MSNDRYDQTQATLTQLVTFRLGREHYGIPVGKVKEIIRPMEACPIPGMAGPVEGVINLRGEIIPVLRIHIVLGSRETEEDSGRKQRVIILESGEGRFGIVVDEVRDVVKIGEEEIKSSPGVSSDHKCEEAILGIAQVGDRMIICLDPRKLVSESLDIEDLTRV
jgi:purine-binding chemotaxis protein CheW